MLSSGRLSCSSKIKNTPRTINETPVLKIIIRLAVSAGLLVFLIVHSDLQMLRSTLAKIGVVDILSATATLFILTPFLAWRWHTIAHAIGVKLTKRSALVIVLIGTFFNQVLPSAIGGDAIRIWLLKKENVSLTKCFSSILLDRVVALFGMVLIVGAGFQLLMQIVRQPTLKLAAGTVIAAGLSGVVILLLLDKIPLPAGLRNHSIALKLLSVASDARRVFFSLRTLAVALVASVIIHLLVSVAVWILARGIGLTVGLEVFVLLLPLVLLLSLLPISVAGWGVREGAMIASLALVDVDAASAFAVSALFGLAYILAGLPGGLVWLFMGKKQKNSNDPS